MSKPYPYQPLGGSHIRILILSPGGLDNVLRGRLETVDLEDSPDFGAISYCWGAPIFDQTLHLGQSELDITGSLHGALRRFRRHTKEVRLWADAICINQDDVDERNRQVNIMAQIFSQARRVLVWLGEGSESDTLAYWMIGALQRYHNKYGFRDSAVHAQSAWDHITSRFDRLYLEEEQACHCCQAHTSIYTGVPSFCSSLKALVVLLERAYFSRMWVVQEITGIREQNHGRVDFYCGKHMRSGTALYSAVSTCDSLISYFDGPVELAPTGPSTPVFATFELLSRVPDHLIYTLMATRNLLCSNPLDRLFGGRALADIEDVESLRPDYNTSPDALWQRVATFLLASPSPRALESDGIDSSFILALIGAHDSSSETGERSSWAPHFGRLGRPARDKQRFYEMECSDGGMRAGGTQVFQARVDPSDCMNLIVRGKQLGTIGAVLPSSHYKARQKAVPTNPEYRRYVESYLVPWYISCYRFLADQQVSIAWRARFAVILRQGAQVGRQVCPPWETIGWLFEKACDQTMPKIESLDARQMFKDLNAFLARRISHGYYLDQTRLLAFTDEGMACWVPEAARMGDAIFVLEGAPFPFVLRPMLAGRYAMLGDSYVHGIMGGEAWPDDASQISNVVLR